MSPLTSPSLTTRAPSLAEYSVTTRCLSGARPVDLTHTVGREHDRTRFWNCFLLPKMFTMDGSRIVVMVWTHACCLLIRASADKLEARRRPGGTPMNRPFHSPMGRLTDSTDEREIDNRI